MHYVAGVVHAETDGQDDVDTGDDVYGDVPEMEEADNVSESEEDGEEDEETELEVGEEHQSDKEHLKMEDTNWKEN